jgi:hypothetical protein
VGNEPFATWNNIPGGTLLGAYRTLRTALVDAGLKSAVKLTVPFQFGIMTDTYVEEEEVQRSA